MDNSLTEILVISPSSLIASRFVEILSPKVDVYGAGQDQSFVEQYLKDFKSLDITNPEQVFSVLKSFPGKYVINFAAITDVSGMEKNKPVNLSNEEELKQNLGYKVNVLGTKNLIDACKKLGKTPIFISTDFVFDGKSGPYKEDDPLVDSPEKVWWYTWTKILAEQIVVSSGIDYLMLRISYPYRSEYEGKSDVVRSFLSLYDKYKSGEVESIYPIFEDQIFTPTFIDDLAPAVIKLCQTQSTGIFHLASPKVANFYEFFCKVLEIARGVKKPEEVLQKGSLAKYKQDHPEYKTPLYGGLKSDKLIKLGFIPTSWEQGIREAFEIKR